MMGHTSDCKTDGPASDLSPPSFTIFVFAPSRIWSLWKACGRNLKAGHCRSVAAQSSKIHILYRSIFALPIRCLHIVALVILGLRVQAADEVQQLDLPELGWMALRL